MEQRYKISKKVLYAAKMYQFHSRLLKKNLDIIMDYLLKNSIIVDGKSTDIIEGQLSMFDFEKILEGTEDEWK